MQKMTSKEQVEGIIRRPIPRKRVGIVHLKMVKEEKTLYGMRRFGNAKEAVEMVRPLFQYMDREIMLAFSLDSKLQPMAVEIVAVGGVDSCIVDVKNIFKHAILNNASNIIIFHNHPSGVPETSREDKKVTMQIGEAGELLGIKLIDHIILGDDDYHSMREHDELDWK